MMSNLLVEFNVLWKLAIYVFLPLVVIILISRVVITIATRRIKKEDEDRYYTIMNYWTSFVAIIVALVLLVVTVIYVIYFTNTMKNRGLVESNKIIYYLVFVFPIIPFSFLIYYVIGFFHFSEEEKMEEIQEKEEYQEEYQFDLGKLNQTEEDLPNLEKAEENKESEQISDNKKQEEEMEIL